MDNKAFVDSILNDIEKAELERFVGNPTQLQAVKKVLLAGVYFNGTLQHGMTPDPARNFALGLASDKSYSNEQIGADLRACAEGIRRVEQGFDVFNLYKAPAAKKTVDKNPGR